MYVLPCERFICVDRYNNTTGGNNGKLKNDGLKKQKVKVKLILITLFT